jgi:hypothetical protein
MFLFKKRKPKCSDIFYIKDVFDSLNISNKHYELITYDIDGVEINYNSFLDFIHFYANHLGIKFNIEFIDEIDELFNGLPIVFDYKEDLESDSYSVTFYLTPFALENLHITICEILLFLIESKINIDGQIEFTEDFKADIENTMRPFLVVACIFYGIGLPLLKRFSVTGSYKYKLTGEVITFKYFVPLDPDFMIFAQRLMSVQNEKKFEIFMDYAKQLNKETRSEIDVCADYIRSNKIESGKDNSYGFFWSDKKNQS